MLNKHNQYFENLHRLGCEYEEKRVAHQEKKQKIIDTFGVRTALTAGSVVCAIGVVIAFIAMRLPAYRAEKS